MSGTGELSLKKNASINSQMIFPVFAILSSPPTLAKSLSNGKIHSLPTTEVPSSWSINYTQNAKKENEVNTVYSKMKALINW